MEDHGGINRSGFTIIIIVILIACGFVKAFTKLWKYSFKLVALLIVVFILLIVIFYKVQVSNSCRGWNEGLAGHIMINSEHQCKTPIPTLCELNIRSNWLNFSKFTSTCDKVKSKFDTEALPDSLKDKEDLKLIGFPRVEDYLEKIKINQDEYRNQVRSDFIDMDDPEVPQEVKDKTEFIVDISDPENHKLNMTLKPDLQRAEQQRKLRKEIIDKEKEDGTYGSRVDKNMLVIYIDNLSRAHFFRKMPETARWLSQFVDNQESDYETYQFFRYHSSYYNTLYSNAAMYYGQVEHVDDTSKNAFDSYAKNGYMTGFFKDSCETNAVSIHDLEPHTHRWDHFGGEVTCDYNYDNTDFKSLSIFSGKGSAIRHCLYGKNMHEYQMDYIKQFWAAYPENRKFFRTHFSEAHELTGELVQYIDRDMRDFLQFFLDQNYLEDTMISFVSDHGAHALTLRIAAIPDNSRYIENYYPILFHVTKKDIPEQAAHFLEVNEQSFIGSHDFYSFLMTVSENSRVTSDAPGSYPYHMEAMPASHDCSDSSVYTADCW